MPMPMDGSIVSHETTSSRATPQGTYKSDSVTPASRSEPSPRVSQSPKENRRLPSTTTDWVDEDNSPPKKRRPRKRSSRHSGDAPTSSSSRSLGQRNLDRDTRHFLPSLGGIREVSETNGSVRLLSNQNPSRRDHNDKVWMRHRLRSEGSYSSTRRPPRYQIGIPQSRTGILFRPNPSLLSTASAVNASSDRSSETSSTITQQSYNRRIEQRARIMGTEGQRWADAHGATEGLLPTQPPAFNVFDYMQPSVEDEDEEHSILSSSLTSMYEASEVGSSELPCSPSSRSTFLSPDIGRSEWMTGLKSTDSQSSASREPTRKNSCGSEKCSGQFAKQATICDTTTDDELLASPLEPFLEADERLISSQRSTSSHCPSSGSGQRSEESFGQHTLPPPQPYFVERVYLQDGSFSNFSTQSDRFIRPAQIAQRAYQWPPSPASLPDPLPGQATNYHNSPTDQSAASDPPCSNRRETAGYQKVALELSTHTSPTRPLYRKFEYLNHRILLHLQDELSEMEEELRVLDEIISQRSVVSKDGARAPSSRRHDAVYGDEVSHHRTLLLGRIFVKIDQYNRTMAAYMAVVKEATPAESEQIELYKRWLETHTPIHEAETQFLSYEEDLVVLGKATRENVGAQHNISVHFLTMLILPLGVYAVISIYVENVFAAALVAVGCFAVAASTELQRMTVRGWTVCCGGIVFLATMISYISQRS